MWSSLSKLVVYVLTIWLVTASLAAGYQFQGRGRFQNWTASEPFNEKVALSDDVLPDYDVTDAADFVGSWTWDQRKMVIVSALGAMDMMHSALHFLNEDRGDGQRRGAIDSSFLRYFNSQEEGYFQNVLGRLLTLLGAPGYSILRSCVFHRKLKFVVGDAYLDPLTFKPITYCQSGNNYAYLYWYRDSPSSGVAYNYIAFCPLFFNTFKLHIQNQIYKNIPFVSQSDFGSSIDDTSLRPPAMSGPSIFMHELFHWFEYLSSAMPVNAMIKDLVLTRPDNQKQVTAYRAFYATKIKDPNWKVEQITIEGTQPGEADRKGPASPLFNVDCYVYTILEIYYRQKFGRDSWDDSPDYQAEVPSLEGPTPPDPLPPSN